MHHHVHSSLESLFLFKKLRPRDSQKPSAMTVSSPQRSWVIHKTAAGREESRMAGMRAESRQRATKKQGCHLRPGSLVLDDLEAQIPTGMSPKPASQDHIFFFANCKELSLGNSQ